MITPLDLSMSYLTHQHFFNPTRMWIEYDFDISFISSSVFYSVFVKVTHISSVSLKNTSKTPTHCYKLQWLVRDWIVIFFLICKKIFFFIFIQIWLWFVCDYTYYQLGFQKHQLMDNVLKFYNIDVHFMYIPIKIWHWQKKKMTPG